MPHDREDWIMTISRQGVIEYQGDAIGNVMASRIAALPRSAREKLKALERAESKRRAAQNEINDRAEKLQARINELSHDINHAEAEIAGGWVNYGKADLARVQGWRNELAELRV